MVFVTCWRALPGRCGGALRQTRSPDSIAPRMDQHDLNRDRYRAFLQLWKTDVAPVHDRTERSREFRTLYARLGLTSLLVAHGVALVAFPVVARFVGAPLAADVHLLILGEASFLAGLLLVFMAMVLAYITLDADVNRQKGERAAARSRLIRIFPDLFGDAPEAEDLKSEAEQRRFWKIGVRLSWLTVVVILLSMACLLAGGIFAGMLLARVAA